MSVPWLNIEKTNVPVSFVGVMSEQLADHLQSQEYEILEDASKLADLITYEEYDHVEQTDNDALLAQLLQLEYDKEYDESISRFEAHRNKHSKVHMSYNKYKIVHPLDESAEKAATRKLAEEANKSDSSSDSDAELLTVKFKNGVHGKGAQMISKHDPKLCGKRNAERVMNFPPDFETGDAHGINMSLSNKVFNELKVHSIHEDKRHNRMHDKSEKSTTEMALDPKTRVILYKLVNNEILESVGGVISTGKEAVILYAPGGKNQEVLVPAECVAKVYKTTLNEFRTRSKYIKDDFRFKDRFKHLNPRKIVKLWAEKEMHNLMKIRAHGILCPEVVTLRKHVLIMSFVGKEEKPAPKLKVAIMSAKELTSAYEQAIQIVTDLYRKCNLVHADFSEYNLLWLDARVWVIDVSQSIEIIDPMALEFLFRDCQNLSKFFRNKEVENVKSAEEIFNDITEQKFQGEGDSFVSEIQKFAKNKHIELQLNDSNAFNFDYFFEKIKSKKFSALNAADDDSSTSSSDEHEEDKSKKGLNKAL